jgi:hypothetical protein
MRSKTVCTKLAVSSGSSAVSSAILLIAGYIGTVVGEAVPGEDMAFASDGTCVLALSLNSVVLESGDTIALYGSNNYYLDSGSGETFAALATYTWPTAESSVAESGVVFIDRVPLAEAVYLRIQSANTGGGTSSGDVSAYLLNN